MHMVNKPIFFMEEMKMKKIIALLLAVMMVMALCACGSDKGGSADLEGYKAYVTEYAKAGAPTEDEKANATAAIAACTTAEEVEACQYLTPMFSGEMILTYDAWVAAGAPAADTSNMVKGDPGASGEPSGEPAA